MKHIFTLVCLLAATACFAQNNVGIGTNAPDSKAMLDISASGKGLLIPRMDSATRVAIATPLPDGLMVFQTDHRKGFWYAISNTWLYIPDEVQANDNLGNHKATQNINLQNNLLVGSDTLNGAPSPSGIRVTGSGYVGIGTTAPLTDFSNNSNNIIGSEGSGLNTHSLLWSVAQEGYAAGVANNGSTALAHGLLVKVGSPSVIALEVSRGTEPFAGLELFNVRGNGYVGIGTNNPFSQLANTSLNTLSSDSSGGGPASLAWAASQNAYAAQVYNGGTGAVANGLLVKVYSSASTAFEVNNGSQFSKGVPLLRVKANGKVGIGTNNPFSQLANTSLNTFGSDGSSGAAGSLAWAASQDGYAAQVYNGGTSGIANGLLVKVNGNASTALEVNKGAQSATGAPLFTVKSNGYVGIGTSTPIGQFANNSGNTIGSDGQGGNPGSMSWAATQNGYAAQVYNGATTVASNGLAVKVNAANATALDVSRGTQSGAATPLLTVKSGGQVGIGTSTPAEALDVSGNIKYSGNLLMGVQYPVSSYIVPGGGTYGVYYQSCPAGTKLIGGGGGNTIFGQGQVNITLNYSGPDLNNLNAWRVLVENNAVDNRTIYVYAICAKVQ